MTAVDRFRVLIFSQLGLVASVCAVSFWNIHSALAFSLVALATGASGYALYRAYRLYDYRRLRMLAMRRRAKKITSSAHQFIIDRIVDLRQPLQGLVSIQDLYHSENVAPGIREYLEIADFCSRYLIRQLERVQYFAELEQDHTKLTPASFSLRACVRAAIGIAREQSNLREIEIKDEWSPYAPDLVDGHEQTLRKVLVELLDNALRFAGGQAVTLRILPDPDNNARLCFVVTDKGPGFSEKQLELLRCPLPLQNKVAPWSDARQGLGLLTVKKILRTVGGTLDVQSTKGMGTSITVVFTQEALHVTRQVESKVSLNGSSLRVLIVDDEPIIRQVLSGLLKKMGVLIEIAENGRQAVEKFSTSKFHLVFMDLEMPILNGFDAAQTILKDLSGNESTKVVALSAHSKPSDRDRCLAIGFHDFLVKPINLDHITECFQRMGFLQESVFVQDTVATGTPEAPREKKTLRTPKERGQYVNFQKLYASLDENMILCADILKQVGFDLEVGLENLATALKDDNRDNMRKILEKLYGELNMILCEPGLKAVQKMEDAARSANPVDLQLAFNELSDLFENITLEIERFTEQEVLTA